MNEELNEQMAAKEHECWSNWMKYMFSKGAEIPDGHGWAMPHWAFSRWTRQMNTPYAELSEEEKQSDRDVFAEYHGAAFDALRADLAAPIPESDGLITWHDANYIPYADHERLMDIPLKALQEARALETDLRARIERQQARIAEFEAAQAWIPCSERLPELEFVTASRDVSVACRYPGAHNYFRMEVQYWRDYGWVYEWKHGKPVKFEDMGYVVDFWHALPELPSPPAD